MAFSSAFKTDSIEQTTAVCHLCEIEPNLKWKCRECNLLMCQRCKDKIHPKFPSAIYHDVVDIKDIGKDEDDQVAELIFTNLKCKLHKSQICSLFCNTCHEIVCPTCFTKRHKAHNLIEVKQGYNKIVDKLKDVDKTIDQQFDTSSINEEKINAAKFVGQINNARATKEIESQAEELLKAVETYKDKLLTDLRQKSNSLFLSLEEERKQTKRTRERLMEQKKKVNEVNEVIQSKDMQEVFAASKLLENIAIPKAAIKNNFDCLPTVIRGQIKNISKVFGSIQENDLKPNLKYNIKQLVLPNFDLLLELNNYKMMFSPDGTMLISDLQTILNLDITTDPVSIISEIKARSNCMAVDSSGDILLSNGSSTLELLCKDTKQILPTGFNISQMKMTAVHVSYNKDIIVAGFLDQATKLVVMNPTAEVKKEYQFDNNKKLLFTEVICITSNQRNSIGIIDITCEGGIGRVLIICLDSNSVTVYTGHSAFKFQGIEFKPYDIVCTALDNFIVLDKQNKSLHIINNKGQAITTFLTDQLIAESPDALCISGTSHLYIACHAIEHYCKTSVYSVDICGW
ncbi:uncharacterized protein LOC127701294 [Mytilus californianus]|uniref:uncharacterized protein LOC127701294 n=1 Tax=Mytilus californianus TaxID=6549 RepID=UPI002246FEEC|nr:uncharacterized protein LOC127701294 [Mytilus californianus]XP_052061126.1 uncharacterized protein LOC127701294 [Mytilus californianus]